MKIGIIDSRHNCYVVDPDIERNVFGDSAEIILYQVADVRELPAEAYTCDGFISWHLVPLNRAFFQNLCKCRAVVRAAVGFDNIDLEAARHHGVQVAGRLGTRLFGFESPADGRAAGITLLLPRCNFADQPLAFTYTPIRALITQHPDLDFNPVQPTGMLGGK